MSGSWCGIFCTLFLGILICAASIAILLLINRNRGLFSIIMESLIR
jgi:uncharacterized protein (DUF3084 family)